MTYATQQDLVDRFGQKELIQLSDHDNTGAINTTVVARALADAQAEIDGYLASAYALPLSQVPDVLVRINADMARFYLFGDRVTQAVADRYANAVDFLKRVATRQVTLGIDEATGQPAMPTSGPRISTPGRVFSRDTLSDF